MSEAGLKEQFLCMSRLSSLTMWPKSSIFLLNKPWFSDRDMLKLSTLIVHGFLLYFCFPYWKPNRRIKAQGLHIFLKNYSFHYGVKTCILSQWPVCQYCYICFLLEAYMFFSLYFQAFCVVWAQLYLKTFCTGGFLKIPSVSSSLSINRQV